MIHAIRVLRAAALVETRYLIGNRFMMFCVAIQPFFVALTTMFMLRHRTNFDPTYVVVGATLTGMWSLVLFNSNWIVGAERWNGTLELIAGAPTSVMLVIAGKMMGTTVISFLSMIVCYAVGAWLFGYPLRVDDPMVFIPSLLFTLGALWASAMLIAPLGILWRWIGQILNIFEYPVYMLAGFLFPVLLLPTWSTPASWALPPFWAAAALHGSSSGTAAVESLLAAWVMLALTSTAAVLIARPFFRLILRRAVSEGTLALS